MSRNKIIRNRRVITAALAISLFFSVSAGFCGCNRTHPADPEETENVSILSGDLETTAKDGGGTLSGMNDDTPENTPDAESVARGIEAEGGNYVISDPDLFKETKVRYIRFKTEKSNGNEILTAKEESALIKKIEQYAKEHKANDESEITDAKSVLILPKKIESITDLRENGYAEISEDAEGNKVVQYTYKNRNEKFDYKFKGVDEKLDFTARYFPGTEVKMTCDELNGASGNVIITFSDILDGNNYQAVYIADYNNDEEKIKNGRLFETNELIAKENEKAAKKAESFFADVLAKANFSEWDEF